MTCLFADRDNCDGPAGYRLVRVDADWRLLGTDEPCCWWHALEQVERLATADEVAYFAPLDAPLPRPGPAGLRGR